MLISVWLKLFVKSVILGIGGEFRYCTDATEECGKCRQCAQCSIEGTGPNMQS